MRARASNLASETSLNALRNAVHSVIIPAESIGVDVCGEVSTGWQLCAEPSTLSGLLPSWYGSGHFIALPHLLQLGIRPSTPFSISP